MQKMQLCKAIRNPSIYELGIKLLFQKMDKKLQQVMSSLDYQKKLQKQKTLLEVYLELQNYLKQEKQKIAR